MISLEKGQKVSLTKENSGLNDVIIGLGWNVISKKRGLFGMGGSSFDCDLDASVICCRNGKYHGTDDLVYFGHLKHDSGAIRHCGDNLTGAGDGDDEQIIIKLDKIPSDIDKLVVVVNIYSAHQRKQDFGMVENAFMRIVDSKTNTELMRYNLTGDYAGSTGMIFGELYRHNGEWKFGAIGQGLDVSSLTELTDRYK